jgi:transposase
LIHAKLGNERYPNGILYSATPAHATPASRESLCQNSTLLGEAALKETVMTIFEYRYEGSARSFFHRWYAWASRSRLQPMFDVARMLKRNLENILTFVRHRITNVGSEGLNSKIQRVKYTARGFRNKSNFINAI